MVSSVNFRKPIRTLTLPSEIRSLESGTAGTFGPDTAAGSKFLSMRSSEVAAKAANARADEHTAEDAKAKGGGRMGVSGFGVGLFGGCATVSPPGDRLERSLRVRR